jgi:hypothetical protein
LAMIWCDIGINDTHLLLIIKEHQFVLRQLRVNLIKLEHHSAHVLGCGENALLSSSSSFVWWLCNPESHIILWYLIVKTKQKSFLLPPLSFVILHSVVTHISSI